MSATVDDVLADMSPPVPRVGQVIPYAQHPAPAAPARPALRLQWASDLAPYDTLRQLVEGLLTEGGSSIWYGQSNSGKTFIAMHMGYCVSRGDPFFGRRTERSAVVYVAAEGAGSVVRRVFAFERHHDRKFGLFGIIPEALCLLEPSGDVDDLIARIKDAEHEIGEKVGLVVIDTVSRVMAGADENSVEDMTRFVAAVDRIRTETGAHVAAIHHSGKDQATGARAHSSLRAAVDTEVEVTHDELARLHSFTVTKQRDLPSRGETFSAKLISVDVSVDQWGQPLTSCAVEEVADSGDRQHAKRLGKGETAVLSYLAGNDKGARRKQIAEALEVQGVSRATTYRAIGALLMTGLVVQTAGLIYAPKA